MYPLYAYVLLASFSVPLLYTIFVQDFIKNWKEFTISTTLVATVFIIWDVFFTKEGIWGFSHQYCLDIRIFTLPIEEWLFFFVIPFCSLFTHFAFFYAFPNFQLNRLAAYVISGVVLLTALVLILFHLDRAYTVVNYSFVAGTTLLAMLYDIQTLRKFSVSFLIILVPFFIVNGILTGAITDTPVVWYNHAENLDLRLYTIPIEDMGYAWSMLLGNLLIFYKLKRQNKSL